MEEILDTLLGSIRRGVQISISVATGTKQTELIPQWAKHRAVQAIGIMDVPDRER